jgi:hypothetical protein
MFPMIRYDLRKYPEKFSDTLFKTSFICYFRKRCSYNFKGICRRPGNPDRQTGYGEIKEVKQDIAFVV